MAIERYDCGKGGAQFCQGCYQMEKSEFGDYIRFDDYEILLKGRDAALSKLAAMESQEPVGVADRRFEQGSEDPYAHTICKFKADVVPEGTKLYAKPVPSHSQQSAAIPKVSCRECNYYAANSAQCVTVGNVRDGLIGRCELARPIIDRCPSHESEQCDANLVEAVTKAILFQDTGSSEDWHDNIDLGEAAIRAISAGWHLTPK